MIYNDKIMCKIIHKSVNIQHPDGMLISIDEKLAPIINFCWKLDINTRGCCEGKDISQINFYSPEDCKILLMYLDSKVDMFQLFNRVVNSWHCKFSPYLTQNLWRGAPRKLDNITTLFFPQNDIDMVNSIIAV